MQHYFIKSKVCCQNSGFDVDLGRPKECWVSIIFQGRGYRRRMCNVHDSYNAVELFSLFPSTFINNFVFHVVFTGQYMTRNMKPKNFIKNIIDQVIQHTCNHLLNFIRTITCKFYQLLHIHDIILNKKIQYSI